MSEIFDQGLDAAFGTKRIEMAPLSRSAPPQLESLFSGRGPAGYGAGRFWTVDPALFASLLSGFPDVPEDAVVFGRNAFGDLFIHCNEGVLMLAVHIDHLEYVESDLETLFRYDLGDPNWQSSFLLRDEFEEALAALGPLGPTECYAWFPALVLGGLRDLSSLRKVGVREQIALLGQLRLSTPIDFNRTFGPG